MVETQQSIGSKGISTFLSFGAKNVQPDILEKMLIGRQKTVGLLEQYVREIAQNGVNHQVFVVGPRGSGKTHLIRVLYYRISDLVREGEVVVSYFAEEEYGISGYLDFLIRTINAFMRWYDTDRAILGAQLDILRETPESRQEYIAETIISDYVGNKPLLILSENFDTILEALGKQGQSKLRAWLYRHNRISIIATSQATTPDLGREDRPFYGFFSTITLKKLSYDESLELLQTLAQIEEREGMITHLNGLGKAQVRAIHELVKGNHRLLVTFYEFLKADSVADLSVIFMKTMNDLKPYYETFIRFLPAQQQKILYYLALAKIPQKGTDIAKNCFIGTTSLTKQLSELQRQHLIDALPDPTDKRNKLYDVSEPLLRIAIEIGEQREGVTALFIDFLALYYSQDEIKTQKERFQNLYLSEIEPLQKQKFYWEVEARERALKVQEEMGVNHKLAREQMKMGNIYFVERNYERAIEYYQKAIQINSNDEWGWFLLGNAYISCDDYDKAVDANQQAIQIDPSFGEAWHGLGFAYAQKGDYSHAISALLKVVELNPKGEKAWSTIGDVYSTQGFYSKAIDSYEEAIRLNPLYQPAWYNLGTAHSKKNSYDKAISAYQQATQLNPNDERAWYNLGNSYYKQGKTLQAIDAYKKAIIILPDSEMMWNNLGVAFDQQGEYDQAIEAFQKAIYLKPNDSMFLYNIGLSYTEKGDYINSIKSHKKSLEINSKDLDNAEVLKELITKSLQSKTATESQIIDLESWLQNRPGFEIVRSYVNIYRRVIFDGKQKALYELPKEQRAFFEREILKR